MRTSLRNTLFSMLSVFTLVMLTGCQGGGGIGDLTNPLGPGGKKYEAAYLKQNLIPGKTTKDQVLQLLGTPHDEDANSSNGSNEITWSYEKSQEPSLDKYLNVAQKYVSTDTFWKINDAKVEANKGQDVMKDINTVTGTSNKKLSNGATGNILRIYFKNNVVDHYYLY